VEPPAAFRERTEDLERASLSSWATLSTETKGRDRYEPEDPLRTAFQVDRERIRCSAAWTRLAGRSATLPARAGRTVLDEATEVVVVARLLARALRLNEDLAEAVATGHRLAAPPYAEAGAEGLRLALGTVPDEAELAVAVVERRAALNLTWETRDGILHQGWDGPRPATLEGDAARFAKRIVGLCAGFDDVAALGGSVRVEPWTTSLLGADHGQRIERLVVDLARTSADRHELTFSPAVARALDVAVGGVVDALTTASDRMAAHARAVHCVASLAVHESERRPDALPAEIALDVCTSTEAEILGRYRAAFEPEG
jgi:dGTPase